VNRGVVYCCVPQLTAFDAKTGKVLWTSDAGFQSECSSVVLWNTGGKDYIVGGNSKKGYFVFCVEAATGKTVWITRPSKGGFSSPVIAGDMLAMNEVEPNARAYRITLAGATFLWGADVPDHRGASLLVHDGYVYTTSGRYFSTPLRCFDLWSGEPKWIGIGDHGGNAEGASPIMADGKIFAQIKDPDAIPERGGSWTVMFRAAPEKFEELGQFHSEGATCTSPSVVDGKLYLRQQKAVACWDIAEHRPYLDGVKVVKVELVFDFKQAEGSIVASGEEIEGLVVSDAVGKPQAAKARVANGCLIIDLKKLVFPMKVSYAVSGNLGAKNGPLVPFEWRSRNRQRIASGYRRPISAAGPGCASL
jgi:outer membrane protein assembly factor BamB